MPSNSSRRLAVLALLVVPLVAGSFFLGRWSDDGYRLFQNVLGLVQRDAVEPPNADSLFQGAARGVVAGLGDRYAELYSPEEFSRFSRNSLGNQYGGIGLRIGRRHGTIAVFRVLPGGPAHEAGMLRGDEIIQVGDSSTAGWSVDQASSHMTGEPGTPVRIRVRRPATAEEFDLPLVRAVIQQQAVPFVAILDGKVGYVPLRRFSDHSAADMAEAVSRLAAAGAERLVIDLRGNPGGSLSQAVALSSLFLRPGELVVRVQYRRDADTLRAAQGPVIPANIPVAVLVDSNSASASEIVAGALQDHDRALLVGTVSYGKGLVQGVYQLDGGWVLRMTTGHWFTPSGRLIQRDHSDTAARTRPVFLSDAGRRVLGGGGISPDVQVFADTLSSGELAVARILGSQLRAADSVLQDYAETLEPEVTTGFAFKPAWRTGLVRQLRNAGFFLPDTLARAGGPYLDRILDGRLSSLALSDSAGFVRNVPLDRQLLTALDLLGRARSQRELYAVALRQPHEG